MLPNELFAVGDGDAGYDIPKSLRFRGSNLAQLSRAFATPTNDKIWTFSAWVKRGSLGSRDTIFNGGGSNCNYICFNNNGTEYFGLTYANSGVAVNVMSNAVFRDVSNHYHLMVIYDSTQAVASERVKLYVNGVRLTSLSAATYPSQNTACYINSNGQTAYIGQRGVGDAASYLEGYVSEVNFIDGQALTPSYFGTWSQDTGQWIPIKYTGTYGNNGFYLDFKDATSLTTLGYDKSGLSNHWTVNNFSLTAGVNYDSVIDTPTNNYATLNPTEPASPLAISFSNANLNIISGGNAGRATIPMKVGSGKWYCEFIVGSGAALANFPLPGLYVLGKGTYWPGYDGDSLGYYQGGALTLNTGTVVSLPTFTSGDVLGIAYNANNGKVWIRKNGVWLGSGTPDPSTDTSPVYTFASLVDRIFGAYSSSGYCPISVNFGQQPFAYAAPDGFNTLCCKNLPVPSIKRGETGFDVVTYTGNGGNIQIGESQFPRFNYQIAKSLRLKGTNSYLNRTPSVVGNRQKFTWSGWVKKVGNGVMQNIFYAYPSVGISDGLVFNTDDTLYFQFNTSPSVNVLYSTTSKFRSNDWMHILVAVDTTLGSSHLDRAKIYVNGVKQTTYLSYDQYGTGGVPLNYNCSINNTVAQWIGQSGASNGYFQGYMADMYLVDGQALDASNFGEFDINGYWIPKAYAGTYGQNGFYLDFEDTTAVANLGYDKSGRGNNWTPNNISLTAGATYDSMDDSPTKSYATINVATAYLNGGTITEGALKISSFNWLQAKATIGVRSGKWYWEFSHTTYNQCAQGICDDTFYMNGSNSIGAVSTGWSASYNQAGAVWINGVLITSSLPTFAIGDIIGYALDMDIGQLDVYKNGVFLATVITGLRDRGTIYPAFSVANNAQIFINFGQRPFTYAAPNGFLPLNANSIAEYTYDLESPDLVWIKCRNAAQNHMLFDSVRGTGKYLSSNLTAAETTDVNSLIQFNKNGFYLGNNANVNTLNNTYAAWMWKASQQQVTNNDGSISCQLKTNPAFGFSIARFTPPAAGGTFGHGLGVKPAFILSKVSNNGTALWWVYHKDYPNGYGYLSNSNAFTTTNAATIWGNNTSVVAPNGTVVSVGNGLTYNSSSSDVINYCFTEIEGFSKFGSYTGNGSADGPFVYCGFKPRFILGKRIDAAEDWFILTPDAGANGSYNFLRANGTTIEAIMVVDILSNGFKMRGAGAPNNTSGGTYIFAAFAECPSKYSNAR